MTFRSLLWLTFAIVALAERPDEETAEANLPTSSESGVKFQWTNSTAGNWYDVINQNHITFSDGVAGWRVADDPETEVIYKYKRNVDFTGGLSPHGADLSVIVNFRVDTTYGDEDSKTIGNTIYYGDLGCGVDMSYSVVITDASGQDSEPTTGGGELNIDVPEGTQKVTLDEKDRVADDHQVATYTGDYLEITTKSKAPKIDANQAVLYHYCPEEWP